MREQQRELVAAEPEGRVAAAAVGQRGCDAAQDAVAVVVPEAVVAELEVVDVDHRERQLMPVAQGERLVLDRVLVEGAVVAESGQRVRERALERGLVPARELASSGEVEEQQGTWQPDQAGRKRLPAHAGDAGVEHRARLVGLEREAPVIGLDRHDVLQVARRVDALLLFAHVRAPGASHLRRQPVLDLTDVLVLAGGDDPAVLVDQLDVGDRGPAGDQLEQLLRLVDGVLALADIAHRPRDRACVGLLVRELLGHERLADGVREQTLGHDPDDHERQERGREQPDDEGRHLVR